jgi:hypothetical protein
VLELRQGLSVTRISKKKRNMSVLKIFGFLIIFVRISIPVRSFRKTDCVESVSARKQNTHSETRREYVYFRLQKYLLRCIRKTKMLAKTVSPCCSSLLHRMNLMWPTNLKLFLKTPATA